jgi:hypothetical protein
VLPYRNAFPEFCVCAWPTVAVNWPLQYFLDEDLEKKNTVKLLWARKNPQVRSALQEHLLKDTAINDYFSLAN